MELCAICPDCPDLSKNVRDGCKPITAGCPDCPDCPD